ncbi:hypothetical protein JRO89_XS10G0205400 [Xanthoceras sorbifolium]|uniref:cyanoalanine nitrilase n=1 Tax=Xanthoceras sorbifolium TaxID=99658 RepID=A0ABQ8HJP9_9ROSI|nr:hypothetical protein JRO89_XS10G0205400 [Xanthoceras sorbifolium]
MAQQAAEGPLFAEVDMGADSSAPTVRATVVQASSIFYDTSATLDKAERLLAEAAGYGSQLVVFPEAFVGGYPRGSNFDVSLGVSIARNPKGKEEFRKYHASAIDVPGPEVERLAGMAGKYKVHLVMGVVERDGYTLYCAVLFFDSQGRYLGKHRKLMPTELERIIWGFGDGSTIPVFKTPIGKIGAAVCWENRMPLLRTAMYAKGCINTRLVFISKDKYYGDQLHASNSLSYSVLDLETLLHYPILPDGIEIYCVPTADDSNAWQASMTHIALEGGCFMLSANQFCRRKDYPPPPDYVFSGTEELNPDSVVCSGGSVIISPSGTVLAGPNYDGEALISADLVVHIDLGEIAKAKFEFDVVGHYSRPEVLSLIVRDHPAMPVTFTSAPLKPEGSHK